MDKKKFTLTDEWKQQVFTTPEGYFESLQERVTARITGAPRMSWIAALRPQLAFALAFVALVVVGYGGLHLLNSLQGDTSPALALDEDYTYTGVLSGIDENTVLRVLSEEQEQHTVNTGDIIDYLADAHISLTDIAFLD